MWKKYINFNVVYVVLFYLAQFRSEFLKTRAWHATSSWWNLICLASSNWQMNLRQYRKVWTQSPDVKKTPLLRADKPMRLATLYNDLHFIIFHYFSSLLSTILSEQTSVAFLLQTIDLFCHLSTAKSLFKAKI